jgi:RHS repeat-associated protein
VNAGLPAVLDDGTQYVHGAGLISQIAGTNTYYYLADGLGSTMKTVDTSGNVVNAYEYDVYGKVKLGSGPGGNEFQFAGQEVDGSTGLQYLRARHYDMETGRFVSRDPLEGQPGWSQSVYGYASDAPASVVDPLGLDSSPSGPTAAERDWCSSWKNLWFGTRLRQCRKASALAGKSAALTVRYYGNDDDDGPPNAFRHCCWLGLIALNFGADTARGFGERHETLAPGEPGYDNPLRRRLAFVDLFNNEVGISIATAIRRRWPPSFHIGKDYDDLIAGCREGVDNGRLIVWRNADGRVPQPE